MIKYKFIYIIIPLIAIVFLTTAALPVSTSTLPTLETSNNDETNQLTAYFFWGEGCPHCAKEEIFLEQVKKDFPGLKIEAYEVFSHPENQEKLQQTAEKLHQTVRGVPVFVIGDNYIEGYLDDQSTGQKILQAIKNNEAPGDSNTVNYPLLGKINLTELSLPLLTIIVGTLDGFNPCSMWALVMLITLLISTGSKKKLWVVGASFILVSAISYYLFLTAWLNVFLFISFLRTTQIIVGVLAVGAGAYFLRDYWKNRKNDLAVCEVTTSETKTKLMTRVQKITELESLGAIILGTALIAWSVNAIEFICSVGLPTVYTGILSLAHLPTWQYYTYIGVYDFFYMLDDIVVLIIAAITFKLVAGNQKYAKYSHLIGGLLILILGIILVIKPDLLMLK